MSDKKITTNENIELEEATAQKGQEMTDDKKAKMVSELIEMGKKSGVLSYKDIADKLADIPMDPNQMEKVYEILENSGIEVVENLDRELEEIQSNEEEIDLTMPDGIGEPINKEEKE